MKRKINFKGKPLSLAGRKMQEEGRAPEFFAVNTELEEVRLSDYDGSIKVITSFLSLDTPVCDLQVKEFNKQAQALAENVVVIGISQDLPFAQKRFCQANNIDKVKTFSDYRTNSFALNYGLLIKELNLLARAVLIIDQENIIRYLQIVEEATNAPDYQAALRALKEVIENPSSGKKEQKNISHCLPCEVGTAPLEKKRQEELLAEVSGWELIEERKIKKMFQFNDFGQAKYFIDLISIIAQEQGHHPGITINYNKVKIFLTTHAVGGLSENDFIMAKIVDQLAV